jgi:hypothetical protein
VVFGDWWSIDEFDRILEIWPAFDFSKQHFAYEGFTHNSQGMLWKKEAHERFGQFDVRLHRTMDYDLILRLGLGEGESRFVRVDDALAGFRRHPDQKTTGFDGRVLAEHQLIADKLGYSDKFQFPGLSKRLLYRARRFYWYNTRRGVGYAVRKALGSVRGRLSS